MAELAANFAPAPAPPVSKTIDEWRADAEAHEQAGRLNEAEALLAHIIQAAPGYHPALHQAAILSYKRKRPLEAIARFERVIELAPDTALYHRNICELYRSQSRLDEAVAHGKRAVELAPEDPGAAYNLGVIHYDRLEIDQAIAAVRRALELDPSQASAHFELAESLLLTGQFEEGWEEYEYRFSLPNAPKLLPPNDRPQWDGKPMPNGTLMLIGDQGFGDTIQFCRYIPEVAKLAPNLIMACSSEMRPIVMQQAGITQYFDRWEHMPAFDAYCPLSGLPRLFGTRLDTIPAPVPYVQADPEKAERWRRRIDALVPKGYRRIALVWAGRPTHGNDFNRSMTLAKLGELAKLDGVALLSLQMGGPQAEIGRYFGRAPLINLGAEIQDFTDTMAILDGVDRLVAVDTGVAHLAGSMGKPVSILVPYAPDWRWLLDRADTPWYPTVSLHRQDAPGQWGGAIAKMLETVKAG
ncbi:MAG TPA: tetratricopeptide repeat protein [Aliidongia sp.]|nr:tetratricopeptide repeat protein [Aliidongia sp.]